VVVIQALGDVENSLGRDAIRSDPLEKGREVPLVRLV